MSNKLSDIHGLIAKVAKNYHFHEPLPWFLYLRDWVAAAYRWLLDWLSSLLSIIHLEADTSAVGNLIKVLFLILAGSSVCLLLLAGWRRFREIADIKPILPTALKITKPFDAKDWFNEAMTNSKAESWKEACRALYMSCLRLLDERGILAFVATRTNYEVWNALRQHKELAGFFRSLATRVDILWFSTKAAQEDDFLSCLAILKKIQDEVEGIDKLEKNYLENIEN